MTKPPAKEQRLLGNARREALLIMAVWAAALVWFVVVGYILGYSREPTEITFILGIPDWVFWSVVLPWIVILVFSVWFCFSFMADDDLGRDQGEDAPHA
jgi:hypothetical protein